MKADLAVKDGKIASVSADIPVHLAEHSYEASNLHLLPGLIDTHVHLNEPGRTEWEGICTGTKSLAAGGVTTYFDMPLNSSPPTTTAAAFQEKKRLADEKAVINYRLWAGLVPENIELLERLGECGAVGFKAFMSGSGIDDFSAADDETLRKGMEWIAKLDSVLAVHAESDHIILPLTKKISKENRYSAKDYAESRPIASEIEAVKKVINLSNETGCKLHIVHVSSSRVVEIIENAKRAGVNITVETCPHYLSLSVDDLEKLGSIAKCAPPLRDRHEMEGLWKCIKKGQIDLIGSDHSPSPITMKRGHLFEAWGGISGAQTTLNILLEEGYWQRNIPLETIVKLTSSNPARRFHLYPAKGCLEVGSDADITVIDLKPTFILKKEQLFYKHAHSPFIGKKLRGKVLSTYVAGQCVYHHEERNPLM